MTPGGTDHVLDGPSTPDDWTVILHEMRARWPEAVSQKVSEREWFVYRDREAFRAGLRGEVTGSDAFVHVFLGDDGVTIAVDPPFEDLGREVLASLERSR